MRTERHIFNPTPGGGPTVRTYVARHSRRHASALKILCVRRSFSFSLSSHDPGEVDDDRFAVYDTVLLEHPFDLRFDTVR